MYLHLSRHQQKLWIMGKEMLKEYEEIVYIPLSSVFFKWVLYDSRSHGKVKMNLPVRCLS